MVIIDIVWIYWVQIAKIVLNGLGVEVGYGVQWEFDADNVVADSKPD